MNACARKGGRGGACHNWKTHMKAWRAFGGEGGGVKKKVVRLTDGAIKTTFPRKRR